MISDRLLQKISYYLFALGIIIRIALIVIRVSPTPDEVWGLLLLRASFYDIWLATFSDLHPPFYFILLKLLSLISPFEFSVTTLRSISLFFGLLANLGMWYLGTVVLGKRGGLIAFILSLFMPAFIWSSIYARYYSLLILMVLLSIFWLIRFVETKKRKYLIYLTIASVLGVYTHYYFFLLDLSFAAFLLIKRQYRLLFKGWIISIIFICLFFLPGLFFLVTLPKPNIAERHRNNFIKIPSILLVDVTSWETLLYQYYKGNPVAYVPSFILMWICAFWLLIYGYQNMQRKYKELFLSVILMPPLIATVFSYTIKPLLALGSLQIFLGAFVIMLSSGIAYDLKNSKVVTILFSATVLAGLFFFVQGSSGLWNMSRDFKYLVSEFKAGDLVLHSNIYSFLIGRYYLGENVNFGIMNSTSASVPTQKALGFKMVSTDSLATANRVWYLGQQGSNYLPQIEKKLGGEFALIRSEDFFDLGSRVIVPYYKVFLYSK